MLRRALCVVILALIGLVPRGAAFAAMPVQQNEAITLEMRAGFDGYVQSTGWIPIIVTASNTGQGVEGELRVTVEGFTGTGKVIYTRAISLPQGSRKQVMLYPADMPAFGTEVQVDLLENGRVLTSARKRVQFIPAEALLIGILSDASASLTDLGKVKPSVGETKVAILTVDDLPDTGMGWSSLDVLAISDVDTGQMSDAQRAAMREWVLGGGRLIIIGGPDFQRTLAGLQDITPLKGQTATDLSVLPLTSAVGAPLNEQGDTEALVTTGELVEGATVLVSTGSDTPLLVTYPLGYGRVDFLAADPALEPLRSWSSLPDLWLMILSTGEVRPGWAFGFNTNNWQSAQDAAASVPGVQLPSVLQLCGFLGVYVLLIGPVNYLVLSRLKRRELAWLTIPLLVVLFSGIAYVTGFQLRGSQVIVHRLSIAHVWEGGDTSKVQSMVGVWSPRRSRYDIAMEQGYYARPMPQGYNVGLTAPIDTTVDQGDPVTLRRVQVDVGSIQSFVMEGYDETPILIDSNLTVEAVQGGIRVKGDIQNASDFDLEHVSLLIAGTARDIEDIPAGEVVQVNMVLSGGQSLPSGGLPYDPTANTGPYGGYYCPYCYDTMTYEIADTDDCYSTDDEKRRCDMLLSVLSAQWRGSGIVLTAFADTSPMEMDVLNGNVKTIDQTLFFVELESAVVQDGSESGVITPGLMTWEMMSDPATSGYVYSPYDFYLSSYNSSPVVFHFQPIALARVPSIGVMEIHIETYYEEGLNPPRVSALNLETGTWERLNVDWGTTRITDADRYVDSSGGVTLSISSGGGDYNIVRFDVTLLEE